MKFVKSKMQLHFSNRLIAFKGKIYKIPGESQVQRQCCDNKEYVVQSF